MYKRNFAMPDFFNGIIEDVMNHNWNNTTNDIKTWAVPVNVTETEASYDLHVVAPGLKKEDFKLGVDKNMLNISYEHKEDTATPQAGKVIRSEYKLKSFKRTFTMTDKIDAGKISAKYTDGILVVSLPKKAVTETPVHEIPVN